MYNRRKEIREIEGISKSYICPAITASTSIIVSLDGAFEKWKPFDRVVVFNNSSSLIYVYINQNEKDVYPVAGKTERVIEDIYCRNLKITEMSAVNVLAGDVVLKLERKGMSADERARQEARKRWLLW